MAKLYKSGYREAVAFVFYRDGKILLEERPKKDIFVPSGGIEEEDASHGDYAANAMLREVQEEMDSRIKVLKYEHIYSYKVSEKRLHFHVFLITKWEGDFPEYTIEDGKKFARLFWVAVDDYPKYAPYPASKHIIEEIKKRLG